MKYIILIVIILCVLFALRYRKHKPYIPVIPKVTTVIPDLIKIPDVPSPNISCDGCSPITNHMSKQIKCKYCNTFTLDYQNK